MQITRENATSLLVAQTITEDQFNEFWEAELAAGIAAARSSSLSIKITDAKRGLWVKHGDMIAARNPGSYLDAVAAAEELGKAGPRQPTYKPAANLVDGVWQVLFGCDDDKRAELGRACRAAGADCLADVLEFIGPCDERHFDPAEVLAEAEERGEAEAARREAAEAAEAADEESDEEYADRMADESDDESDDE